MTFFRRDSEFNIVFDLRRIPEVCYEPNSLCSSVDLTRHVDAGSLDASLVTFFTVGLDGVQVFSPSQDAVPSEHIRLKSQLTRFEMFTHQTIAILSCPPDDKVRIKHGKAESREFTI